MYGPIAQPVQFAQRHPRPDQQRPLGHIRPFSPIGATYAPALPQQSALLAQLLAQHGYVQPGGSMVATPAPAEPFAQTGKTGKPGYPGEPVFGGSKKQGYPDQPVFQRAGGQYVHGQQYIMGHGKGRPVSSTFGGRPRSNFARLSQQLAGNPLIGY